MTVGVVLAGGRSQRMGRDKALIEINGATMLEHVALALNSVCELVVVVGRPDGPAPNVEYIPDTGDQYRGPLSGICAAIAHTNSNVLVVATDQPRVRSETLQHILNLSNEMPVIPEADGWPQITCAWYPASLLPVLQAELADGSSVRSALKDQPVRVVPEEEWRAWGEDGASWDSLDTPHQLETRTRD